MTIRQARKIAKRVGSLKASQCHYTDWQLFRAFARLHTEWRKRRHVEKDEEGRVTYRVTEDFFRSQRVWQNVLRRQLGLPRVDAGAQ